MKATDTKATQRDKRKAGLSALLRDDEQGEEIANDAPAFNITAETGTKAVANKIPHLAKEKHKSPMTLNEIAESETALIHEIRVTLQMPAELHKKIKIMAHWELTSLKDIINASLEATVLEYEKTHGQLANVPKSQRGK